MQRKQAKLLPNELQDQVLEYLETTRHPDRNVVMFLLSMKAGLRAKEIALLRWRCVIDARGHIGEEVIVEDQASKGGYSGRRVPMNNRLQARLDKLRRISLATPDDCVIISGRTGRGFSAQSVVNTFYLWYRELGFVGVSSHSGRRTFITNAAKKINLVEGSLRDVQLMAGHKHLHTTQRYIEGDERARKRVVNLI
jgi:integrase